MAVLSRFRVTLADELRLRNLEVRRWQPGLSPNLLELSTTPTPTVLYVKEFSVADRPGFWGLTRNQITRLQLARTKWFVVLLLRTATDGYVLTADEIRRHIQSGAFELSNDGDYKVHEKNDLTTPDRFNGIGRLLARIF